MRLSQAFLSTQKAKWEEGLRELGHKFIIQTDHHSLGKQYSTFKMELGTPAIVVHRPGSTNFNADTLSRCPMQQTCKFAAWEGGKGCKEFTLDL
jgi:hypothetical protein